MKILVTGAGGQVGEELVRRRSEHPADLIGLRRSDLDITDADAIRTRLEEQSPDLVVNAAAYTAVDRAEEEPALAAAVNRDGPARLARECSRRGIPLVHYSTDYIFDGASDSPAVEDQPAAPLGVYGRTKWEGEEAVRQETTKHLVLRVSWVFSAHGHNFVRTMLRLGREREELGVVADQWGCPTWAGHVADVTLELARRLESAGDFPWGTYHYCGSPATTWHAFAEEIFREAGARERLRVGVVKAITTSDYPTPARRPLRSILSCSRFEATFGLAPPPWRDGLRAVLKEIYRD